MNLIKYNQIIEQYNNKEITEDEFENQITTITESLTSPLKEFYYLKAFLRKNCWVIKKQRQYLLNNYSKILESDLISFDDKLQIKCAAMEAYFRNHQYFEAENLANDLINSNTNDIMIDKVLALYYTQTRRYDLAQKLYEKYPNEEILNNNYEILQNILNGQRKEYLPLTDRNLYYDFLKSLNINIKIIEKDYKKINLKSFVAFDLETTGFSPKFDDITEIAAIKVVDGKIEETKKFMFQELVHPMKKEIPFNVEAITGITNEMVKDARLVNDVIKDFQKFIGDDILVGYNCLKFDRLFLNEACQLAGIKITNPYFDVLDYVPRFYNKLHFESRTLATISKVLDIKNPQAHRALADAITTAKVFLKLQELEQEKIGILN